LSAQMFLNTSRDITVLTKSGMQYIYLGITQQFQNFVLHAPKVTELELSINIDGLLLLKEFDDITAACAMCGYECQTRGSVSNFSFLRPN